MTIETAFTTCPTLYTTRFILRQVRPTDAEALFEVFSDVETMQFYGSEPHPSLAYTRQLIDYLRTCYDMRENFTWAVTRIGDDTAIGMCSFHQFAYQFKRVETGYILHRAY